jgi:hypothetical protein
MHPKSVTGYGYVGQWRDGTLGWFGTSSITRYHSRKYPGGPSNGWEQSAVAGDRAFLCRITVTPVYDKQRRPITRLKAEVDGA